MNSLNKDAENYAEEQRKELGLTDEPINDVFSILQASNIFIIKVPIEDGVLSGCFYHDKEIKQSWVMINSAHILARQHFTAVHEYCHFLRDRDKEFIICEETGRKPAHEVFADQFAASFLMPRALIERYFADNKEPAPGRILEFALEFGVSYSALLWRLLALDIINNPNRAFYAAKSPMSIASKIGRMRDSSKLFSPTYETTVPHEYYDLTMTLYKNKLMTRAKLADYLDVETDDIDEYLKQIKQVK